jgi:hypothetical protein
LTDFHVDVRGVLGWFEQIQGFTGSYLDFLMCLQNERQCSFDSDD